MIQRIQTLYLLVAFVLCVVCLSLPVGYYITDEGERVANLYNLCLRYSPSFVVEGMSGISMKPWALFGLLLATSVLCFVDIFLFRRRALQMRLCSFSIIFLIGWYAIYGAFIYFVGSGLEAHFRPGWVAALPFCCIVLLYLAFRGIMKDEMLVRSLDRLR